ncbi:hypothetical protein LCGC14_1104330 [marine sediment metagenome]|uniref:Uncharacterized protein n=1 Tax=marine sediment metagenome TaxID=412755 RepID=A0A0F9M8N9_9ZZZZ
MSIASRLASVEEFLRGIGNALRLQGRRVSAAAPSDNELLGWNATTKKWEPKAGVLNADLTQVDVANEGDETSLYSYTIPADTLGATGGFKLFVAGDMLVNDGAANTLRIRVKLGSTTVFSSDAKDIQDSVDRYKWGLQVWCMNSTTNAQKWGLSLVTSASSSTWPMKILADAKGLIASAYNSSTEDTTTDLVLAVTADWSAASANDSIRKEMAILERIGLSAGTGGGGVKDHGGLTGLGDDDHTGYLLAAGTRAGSTGSAQDFGATGIKADVIAESTGAAGVTIAGFMGLAEVATPANPAQNKLRLFARANGTDIELISLSSTGAECVICTLANGAAPANVLTLNWIE